MSQDKVTHALVRTSPKGGPFIGNCILCGKTNLKASDALKRCSNPDKLSSDQVVLEVLDYVR